MKRFKGNPILEPIGKHPWESRLVFNAAVVSINNQIHLLYRAIGNDHVSRIGYALSSDGYNIDERFPDPVFSPAVDTELEGCEDPRLTLINGNLHLVYTVLEIMRGKKYSKFLKQEFQSKIFYGKSGNGRRDIYLFQASNGVAYG